MAIEKVIVVKSQDQKMAQNNNPYLEVIAQDDKKYTIFDQGLWNLFGVNLAVKLHLEKKSNYWNVIGAESVQNAVEAKEAIEKQGDEQNPQKEGMCLKEVGNLIIAEKLAMIYGKENAIGILKWYRGYLSSTLKFPCDGAKLPTFMKAKEEQ